MHLHLTPSNCCLAGIVICAIICTIYALRLKQLIYTADKFFEQTDQYYFYGHKLSNVILLGLFQRLRSTQNYTYCTVSTALTMLALRNFPTARLADGEFRSDDGQLAWHRWVEFRCLGRWYVVDNCWIYPNLMPRRRYYRHVQIRPQHVYTYDQFWSHRMAGELYKRLRHPETSFLFFELYYCYCLTDEAGHYFCRSDIDNLELGAQNGTSTHSYLYAEYPDVIISRRVIDELMARPTRRHPKAHTIRHIRKAQRLAQQYYSEHESG